jgi:hypothetical protein
MNQPGRSSVPSPGEGVLADSGSHPGEGLPQWYLFLGVFNFPRPLCVSASTVDGSLVMCDRGACSGTCLGAGPPHRHRRGQRPPDMLIWPSFYLPRLLSVLTGDLALQGLGLCVFVSLASHRVVHGSQERCE